MMANKVQRETLLLYKTQVYSLNVTTADKYVVRYLHSYNLPIQIYKSTSSVCQSLRKIIIFCILHDDSFHVFKGGDETKQLTYFQVGASFCEVKHLRDVLVSNGMY